MRHHLCYTSTTSAMLFDSYFVTVMSAISEQSECLPFLAFQFQTCPPQRCRRKTMEIFLSIRQTVVNACYKAEEISVCLLRTDMSCHVHTKPLHNAWLKLLKHITTHVYIVSIRYLLAQAQTGFRSIYLTLRSVTQNNVAQAIIGVLAGYTAYPQLWQYIWCNSEGSVLSWLRTLHEPLHVVAKPL